MANPFSNRKKVRGWQRRVRQLMAFREAHIRIDVQALDDHGVQYVKIWLDPWSRLVPRNPPMWYRGLVAKELEAIHDSWLETLQAGPKPFYLRLWLFEPRFYASQLVAAVDERIEWYEGLFQPDAGIAPEPPAQYGLSEFHWTPCVDEEDLVVEESDFSERSWRTLRRNAGLVRDLGNGEIQVRRRLGNVWIGSKGASSDSVPASWLS